MSVNGVAGSSDMYGAYSVSSSVKSEETKENKKAVNSFDSEAAVYEPSKDTVSSDKTKKTYTQDPELINRLKADAEARTQQLQDIVSKLLTKQGKTFNAANGLKSLYENLEVDAATREQAQKDIAEDGYWGVKQTSGRIFEFAMALTGGDPDKMKEMKTAFEKGFKQATDAWGDELPDICQDTYGAVLNKFDEYLNESEENQ